ncbi:cysteine hydrolase family protein [Taylorella equigenitalis]|uniref:Nicotinamidase n=2 Tax=Taylorella equigenitalis TaxID=29575 RepID=A0A654KIH4_TAYEM|nr:isochorismatase family protein [Taylorella equigenitalis]ADU92212.1 Nicotinamidase [Taylorella equigenitalis MCE9]AFN35768.1 cysteine hydrolase family protein [Taylorella equigenitalis ATCC 35865]ASY39183.1 cysteine hydrolase [Taylorella equigenitalis]WDU56962.1 isochorismatase family protein [Taylorella equigenitalis]VEG30812.1 Isochorismatase family [Taylorella equigenitalis ATCC 35865]
MKKLLVVVDFQKDFVDGALGFEGASILEPVIVNKIKEYEAAGYDIVFTLDTHGANYLETMEGKWLPVPHVIKGSEGHQIYGRVRELSKKHTCIEKPAFGSLCLVDYIQEHGFYDEIELCGLVSTICVFCNAIIVKAASPESRIFIDSKATDSFDKEMQVKCYDLLRHNHIEVV